MRSNFVGLKHLLAICVHQLNAAYINVNQANMNIKTTDEHRLLISVFICGKKVRLI